MHLLVIGGTRFIGRHLVELALAHGHRVTVFHRGRVGPELVASAADHRIGDRDRDLTPLAHGGWDATVDLCAYVPRHVHELADVLGPRAGRYTLVSSVSVYHRDVAPGFAEDGALAQLDDPTTEVVTDDTYGGLKVLCERAAADRFDQPFVVRPTYVVGPHDLSWRFPWWLMRLARGGTVLAPGPAGAPVQVIDVRDLAAWLLTLVTGGRAGTFHTVGPVVPITWGHLLDQVAALVAPAGTALEWVDPGFLHTHGLDDTLLPLWPAADPPNMATADPGAALAAGLTLRPLAETVAATLAWARTDAPPAVPTRLSGTREAELLRSWKQAR